MSTITPDERGQEIRSTTHKKAQNADNHGGYTKKNPLAADTALTQRADPVEQGIISPPGGRHLIPMRDYIPARLVKARDRWYFLFYQTNPTSGKRERHRETYDIGRLPLAERTPMAQKIIDGINARLPFGYPFDQDFYQRAVHMTTASAFAIVQTAQSDLRPASRLSYASTMRKFCAFLTRIHLQDAPVSSISKKIALAFADDMLKSGNAATTYNSDITDLKRAFNVLKEREIVTINPFIGIAKRREAPKQRRGLTGGETQLIMAELRTRDVSCHLACALLYFCLIRPNEQRFIRRADIDLARSTIEIPAQAAKNRKTACVTIPDQLRDILIAGGVELLHPSQYLLGGARMYGASTPVGKNSMGERYRRITRAMFAAGLLHSLEGNSIYSWKDTGADALGRSGVNAIAFRDQGRWHSLTESETYLGARRGADPYIKANHRLP